MGLSPFFTVHSELPREGPGEPDDVLWALDVAGTPDDCCLCDAACGPGADTLTLAQARPDAMIDAMDLQAHFVDAAKARTAHFGDRINVEQRDYANLPGQYDLIWCAGAAYFVGYLNALEMWTKHLRPGGAIAFSEPVLVSEPISQPVLDFWGSHEALNVPKTLESLNVAGWDVLGHRVIVGAPWAAYYDPMRARIAALRAGGADAALRGAIEEAEEEITQWEACSDEIAYGLFVVRPT